MSMCHSHRTRQLQRSIASLSLQRKASCAAWHNPCISALSLIQHLESQVTCCGPALGDVDMLELLEASCSLRARSDPLEPKTENSPGLKHRTAPPTPASQRLSARCGSASGGPAPRRAARLSCRTRQGIASLGAFQSRIACASHQVRGCSYFYSNAGMALSPCCRSRAASL